MATCTANKKYNYDDIFHNKTLDYWIQECHKYNCEISGWKYNPLKKGAYGYDNLAIVLGNIFTHKDENLCENIHSSWIENYIYWRDNEPYINNKNYIKPYSPLNDTRRNMLVNLKFAELDEEEKKKDEIIRDFIKNNFNF